MTAAAPHQTGTKYRFDRAEVLAFDPIPANAATLRSSAEMIGFHRVRVAHHVPDALELIRATSFDVFFADVTQNTDKVCDLVRTMREGRAGANPFLHVILLAWKLDNGIVRQAWSCGADEFVTRPFSVTFLDARLKALMTARADFVVTGEYIGPDRRRDQQRRKEATPFAAPNALKTKCQEHFDLARSGPALRAEIQAACLKLNADRIQKNALQLPVLVSFLKEAFTDMDPLEPGLEQLNTIATDMVERARSTGARKILSIVEPMLNSVAGAQSGSNVAAQIEAVNRLARDLYLAVIPGASLDSLKQEIERERAASKAKRA